MEKIYQLAAHLSDFLVIDEFLVQGGLCVTLRVPLDVGQGNLDPDRGSYRCTHAFSVLLGTLQVHIYLVIDTVVLALLYF